MGLLNKLFQINKTNHRHPPISDIHLSEANIRILLFRECEFKGRKVLFDTWKGDGAPSETTPLPNVPPHNQLAEMVFGSVAMGFNSCCFKIHVIQPETLVLAQIFPSPRHRERPRCNSTSQCLEQSAIFEDSATSSTNSSASDQLSTYSSTSDQILGDSLSSLSSGNVYKKWVRSTTNSGSSFGSVKDNTSHHRSSKLAFVLMLSAAHSLHSFMNFCMEHISLLESLLHRCRRLIEIAYTKPQSFQAAMEEVARLSKQGVLNLVTTPNLASSLQSNCDSVAFSAVSSVSRTNFFARIFNEVIGHARFNKSPRTEGGPFDKFVNEFCGLLELTDSKETSFFMSSLVTAVLTHHLGWVQTCINLNRENSSSPEWTQLLTLYGAVGHPNKMAQTLVTGNSEAIMLKVLNCLAYFIRCCDIKKYQLQRSNVREDNELAEKLYEESHNLDKLNNNKIVTTFQNNVQKPVETLKCRGLIKTKSICNNLLGALEQDINENISIRGNEIVTNAEDVVFILGDNETLTGMNRTLDIQDVNDNVIHSIGMKQLDANARTKSLMSLQIPTRKLDNCKFGSLNLTQQEHIGNEGNKSMRVLWMPMPKSKRETKESKSNILSVLKGVSDNYMPDMVLQGTNRPKIEWIYKLKNDLALTSQQTQFAKFVDEVVAILANINTWEVHLMSSHTYVIDPNATGIRVYMSQLVASMLETLYVMWKLQVPINRCIQHIENSMCEICIKSKTMAQMLLKTPFCSVETLNKTLHLDVNDVPLLMAIASVHSPEVTRKYGLSFQ